MAWKGARPLVQGRVELGDDALFPLLVRMAQLRSRLVRRVLRGGMRSTSRALFSRALTMVRFAKARIWPSRSSWTNPDTLDGWSGGCLNSGSPSSVSQYSSSHSVGSARSKLSRGQ